MPESQTKSVVIVADLRETSQSRDRAIGLYNALAQCDEARPHFFYFPDSKDEIEKYGSPVRTTGSIKNSVVVMFRELKDYFRLDSGNTLVYMADSGRIEQYMSFLIHRVDRVMVPDYCSAYRIAAALTRIHLDTPVHRLPPWMDLSLYERHRIEDGPLEIGMHGGEDRLVHAVLRTSDVKVTTSGGPAAHDWTIDPDMDPTKFDVYVHLVDDEPERVRRAMSAGVIPVAKRISPYPEWIHAGLNGFLVSSEQELGEVIALLKDKMQLRTFQEISMVGARNTISRDAWARMFMRTVHGHGVENLNEPGLFSDNAPSGRNFIVPKIVLEKGKETLVPKAYDPSFRVLKLADLEEILIYLATQRFDEVYVFDWDYGDASDVERRGKITNLIRALGRRLRGVFWCSDRPTPQGWESVWKYMTRFSSQEGLKRVAVQRGRKKVASRI